MKRLFDYNCYATIQWLEVLVSGKIDDTYEFCPLIQVGYLECCNTFGIGSCDVAFKIGRAHRLNSSHAR